MRFIILLPCTALMLVAHTGLAYNSEETQKEDWRPRRGRLVASSTLREATAVRHPLLNALDDADDAESTGGVSSSNELIRQFIPSGKSSQLLPFDRRRIGKEVECPDKESVCPEGTTCCPLDKEGAYGCCPTPKAVCCSDKIHCCPNGMTCDSSEGMCQPSDNSAADASDLLKKLPAKRVVRKTGVKTTMAQLKCVFPSADSAERERFTQTCPSGSVCCFDGVNDSALCCPYRDGVCCDTSRSCCPSAFKCTVSGDCIAILHRNPLVEVSNFRYSKHISTLPQPLYQTTDKKAKSVSNDNTICNDGSECSGYATCCPVHNAITGLVESYRCCELSRATCCGASADFCCPHGYSCARGQRCERFSLVNIFI